jgi:hypothetical protein
MRSVLDSLAARFPGGPQGNRSLTALLGAVLLVGIGVEFATLVLGLRHTLTDFFRAVHSASFALFLLVVSAHALAHLSKLRRFAFADWARGRRARGHTLRRTLVGFALVTGASLAVAVVEAPGPWIQAIHNSVGA